MKLPNLIIAGAPKAGSSSLFYWLESHSDVYGAPCKETFFLSKFNLNLDIWEKNKGIYNFLFNSHLSLATKKILKSFMPLKMRRQLASNLQSNLLSKPEPMTPEIRESLKDIYREDIQKLEKLLNLNLK